MAKEAYNVAYRQARDYLSDCFPKLWATMKQEDKHDTIRVGLGEPWSNTRALPEEILKMACDNFEFAETDQGNGEPMDGQFWFCGTISESG